MSLGRTLLVALSLVHSSHLSSDSESGCKRIERNANPQKEQELSAEADLGKRTLHIFIDGVQQTGTDYSSSAFSTITVWVDCSAVQLDGLGVVDRGSDGKPQLDINADLQIGLGADLQVYTQIRH
ncbi:hypothetical protein BLNAU_7120 [Blattamonas nauphoetae]|uniref:Uncharacterized protein n=1 Tax=Blattamonas nauphoetae TaxID=2049346 RepID=A0ABQ9Y2H4_9EUKA|nr:hypothetical protein BLNAU_7120 [Blattamonas nauphoetae]